jgi:hypothetical protein
MRIKLKKMMKLKKKEKKSGGTCFTKVKRVHGLT